MVVLREGDNSGNDAIRKKLVIELCASMHEIEWMMLGCEVELRKKIKVII